MKKSSRKKGGDFIPINQRNGDGHSYKGDFMSDCTINVKNKVISRKDFGDGMYRKCTSLLTLSIFALISVASLKFQSHNSALDIPPIPQDDVKFLSLRNKKRLISREWEKETPVKNYRSVWTDLPKVKDPLDDIVLDDDENPVEVRKKKMIAKIKRDIDSPTMLKDMNEFTFSKKFLAEFNKLHMQTIHDQLADNPRPERVWLGGPYNNVSLFVVASGWSSVNDIRWLTMDTVEATLLFEKYFDKLKVADKFKFLGDYEPITSYITYRQKNDDTKWHYDYTATGLNGAFTLMIPLQEMHNDPTHGNLLYVLKSGKKAEVYTYKYGKGFAIGDFMHTTQPGRLERPVAFLTFAMAKKNLSRYHFNSALMYLYPHCSLYRDVDGSLSSDNPLSNSQFFTDLVYESLRNETVMRAYVYKRAGFLINQEVMQSF